MNRTGFPFPSFGIRSLFTIYRNIPAPNARKIACTSSIPMNIEANRALSGRLPDRLLREPEGLEPGAGRYRAMIWIRDVLLSCPVSSDIPSKIYEKVSDIQTLVQPDWIVGLIFNHQSYLPSKNFFESSLVNNIVFAIPHPSVNGLRNKAPRMISTIAIQRGAFSNF